MIARRKVSSKIATILALCLLAMAVVAQSASATEPITSFGIGTSSTTAGGHPDLTASFTLGEPDGSRSERIKKIAEALIASGLRAPVTTHLRNEIWVKILGNVAFNPISALTGATLAQILTNPESTNLVRNIMQETEALTEKLGVKMQVSIEQRMAGAAKVGEHKTSMLQDLEAGRPLELEAIVGAVLEVGERIGLPMPHTRSVYACTKLLAERRSAAAHKT